MNNLSTAGTDISSQIGALELGGDLESHGDGELETAAHISAGPNTNNARLYCASDAALEEAGMSMGDTQRPTSPRPYGRCISDGALEEAGMSMGDTQRPTSPRPYGRCINDGALEAAGGAIGPSQTIMSGCRPTLICAASIA